MPGRAFLHYKGGFRQVVLAGNLLHQGIVQPTIQAIDHRWVTGKRLRGKGIDLVKFKLHGTHSGFFVR